MTNIQELRLELKTVCELINDILSDTESPVIDRKNPMYSEANVAFFKLELYCQNLSEQIAKLQRRAA